MPLLDYRIPELPELRVWATNDAIAIYDNSTDKTCRIKLSDLGVHLQNSDSGTVNTEYEIAYQSQNQDPDGRTVLIFGGQQGGKRGAIAFNWAQGNGNDAFVFEKCLDYTGSVNDVWEALGTGGTSAPVQDNGNFEPYDPTSDNYNSTTPSFASYGGNVYLYIGATPHDPNNPVYPGTNGAVWELASSGLFPHLQNTDTGTTSKVFTFGDPRVTAATGNNILAFRTNGGELMALRNRWDDNTSTRVFEQCLNYSEVGPNLWTSIGGTLNLSDIPYEFSLIHTSSVRDVWFDEKVNVQDLKIMGEATGATWRLGKMVSGTLTWGTTKTSVADINTELNALTAQNVADSYNIEVTAVFPQGKEFGGVRYKAVKIV